MSLTKNHQVSAPTARRVDSRGTLTEIVNSGTWRSLLLGEMKDGAVVGNHYHHETTVFIYLISGAARVELRDAETGARSGYDLTAGFGTQLETGVSHAIRFLQPSRYIILKSKPYDPGDPDTFFLPVEEAAG